jgi:cell division protein FtsL
MATASAALPAPRRRPRVERTSGRAAVPDIYFVKAIDNSRLTREVDRKKRRECWRLLGLGLVVFALSLLYGWQHFQGVRYGYEIEQLKLKQAQLEDWNRQLRLEQAQLEDPQRIDALAQGQLGLIPPDPRRVIRVDGVTALPGAASVPQLARNVPAVGSITTLTPKP